jgi:hypothetical protein
MQSNQLTHPQPPTPLTSQPGSLLTHLLAEPDVASRWLFALSDHNAQDTYPAILGAIFSSGSD